MSSSVSSKKSKLRNSINHNTDRPPDDSKEPRSIHVLSRWLQKLHINQTEDKSMAEPDGIPVVEEDGKLKPRCHGGFQPIPCSDFINWIPTVGLEDLVIKDLVLWRNRDPPWHHEFVVVMFEPDDKYTGPNDIFLPNLSENVPIQKLVATGLTLRIDRGRRSPVPFGSRQIAVDVVEIMNPDADLGNCAEFWSAHADHSRDVEFFPTMRDLAYFLENTMAKLGEDYHLLRRNCWNFAARLISLLTFHFIHCWDLSEDRLEVIWARQKFGGFDGFRSTIRHLDSMGLDNMPRNQSPFRGFIDVLRGLRKKSSSNSVKSFPFVWMPSLSPALVGDLVDLDISFIPIVYSHVNKDNPARLFRALYTLTRLAKGGDSKAKAMLVKSDIFERSAKYMQTCQWSEESDRALIHIVINAFGSLFSKGADVEIGNAFAKSGWILALPRVFIFCPDHLVTIALYFKLQSIEAARSHLITTGVLHSIFSFIQSHKDINLQLPLVMIWNITKWSPSSRQSLLGAGIGTTITEILQSRKALDKKTLHYLVKLLESLILVDSSQEKHFHSLINKGALDSLKNAGVFQALQENYPTVLLFRLFAGTQQLEELASNPWQVMARFAKTQPELASEVMSDLLKESFVGEGDVTAFRSIFPDVELSMYGFDPRDASDSAYTSTVVNIGGRDLDEEMAWWNADLRNACQRPGPGILPSALTELLHDSEHSLLSVVVTPPHIGPQEQRVNPNINLNAVSPMTPPPTPNEVHTAIPHPHAFYCRSHNGWVVIIWKSLSALPPLAKSFKSNAPMLYSQGKKVASCVGGEQPHVNKTHHFHAFKKAVDGRDLNPPFRRTDWESLVETHPENLDEDKQGHLFDLYLCCQCSVYCVVSEVIPGVIPKEYIEKFCNQKLNNPLPGRNGEITLAIAWGTFLKILEDRLWRGKDRPIPIQNNRFQTKMGWDSNIEKVFKFLGYDVRPVSAEDTRLSLCAPSLDPNTQEGKQSRAKLLRAWVEISVWLSVYLQINTRALSGLNMRNALGVKVVRVVSAREMYQRALGAHPEHFSHGGLPDVLASYEPISKACLAFGFTPSTYTLDLLVFAYLAQCRCDPANTVTYFTHFFNIVNAFQEHGGDVPRELQMLLTVERSRNRFTFDELSAAFRMLGFGIDGQLGVGFKDDIEDDFVENAWRKTVRKVWRDPYTGHAMLRDVHVAFRVLTEGWGSVRLRRLWESDIAKILLEDAYAVLEIPENAEESMLCAVFSMRVQEFPAQAEKWREALSIIAKLRKSERLCRFLKTAPNPADLVVTSQDLPRGLNQLDNTCYLNSLLQYFYIIRDLRDAIAHSDVKIVEGDKLTDDDLERHRVGGRNVTRREIVRAKKFVGHLADLFWQMEHYQTASITPARELANLALLTSKDEEDEESDNLKGGMDVSNNALLAGDRQSQFPIFESLNFAKPPSVLGKCQRDDSEVIVEFFEDSSKTGPQRNTSSRSETSPPPKQARPSKRSRMTTLVPLDCDDAMMSNSRVGEGPSQKVTSLPVRNAEALEPFKIFGDTLPHNKTSRLSVCSGQQHDVFECMDNCMFQIEAALLKFDKSRDGKPNVVKRLFYGKIRQRILLGTVDQPFFNHNKEDLFSHLPVSVSDDGTDLYDGLSRYMNNVIEYQGRKARMKVSVVELPSILQIQLQRAQFDRETQRSYKSQAYVKFWETIYMDRFLETADPQKKLKSDTIQAKLDACRDKIKVLNQTDEQESLEVEQLQVRAINLKKKLERIWRDETVAPYELASVFIHDGPSPSWGHYFLYSRHLPECPDSWFKYNDSEVMKVSKNEVLADTMGSTANPYLLVFVRKGQEVIDTVKRVNIMMHHEKTREIR